MHILIKKILYLLNYINKGCNKNTINKNFCIFFMNLTTIRFLIALKNHSILKKEVLIYRYSKSIIHVLTALYQEGYIQSFKILNNKLVYIALRYYFNKPILKNLKLISTLSKPTYLTLKSLYNITDNKNTIFFSTSKGIKTLYQCKREKLGGEALFSC